MDNSHRDTGINVIKAVSIVLVLIWHLKPIPINADGIYALPAARYIYHYITLLAVPSFIVISLYLFFKKSFFTAGYWRKRMLRLVQLFLFWTCIQFIFYLLAGGKLPLPLNSIIPSGGPELPYVGGSVFYFLFILIICTLLAFLFMKLTATIKLFLSIALIALTCVHFTLSPIYNLPIDTMAMENYYIYIPIAYYMEKYKEKFIRCRTIFIVGYVMAIFYEEFFTHNLVSAYGRLSILLGTLSFISIFLSARFASKRPMEFLSKYSLGIFALHKYWLYIFIVLLGTIKAAGSISSLNVFEESGALFIATVIFTCLSVYLLNKTKMRIYIS